jgi:GDP-4-dehydro-6-deoxy-D-mannose reductase
MARRAERILITGSNGFAGSYLRSALDAAGRRWIGLGRGVPFDHRSRQADLSDRERVLDVVREVEPTAVVHLAAMTYLPEVLAEPLRSTRVNVIGTQNLLDAVRDSVPAARVLMISSGTVYGAPPAEELPVSEDAPLRAVHPYGIQKIAAELLAERARAEGLDVVVVRPFNHVGPGQDGRISVNHFARQIVAAERGEVEPLIRVGNLEPRRDILDVRDVVRAYLGLLDAEHPPSPVNVARGESVRIGDALDMLLRAARVAVRVEADPSRYRPLDVPDICGDSRRLRSATGWSPEIPLADTLLGILAHLRQLPREGS